MHIDKTMKHFSVINQYNYQLSLPCACLLPISFPKLAVARTPSSEAEPLMI